MSRGKILILLSVSVLTACAPDASHDCPVTLPNGQGAPGQETSQYGHGNGQLWTALWPDGVVEFRPGGPGEIREDGSLWMKFPWSRGDGIRGALEITGRRLDGPAGPLRAHIPEGYGETGFQSTAIGFPTEGCWEITAKAGAGELTVVVYAMRVGE